jgi:hypothetical protein
MARPQSVTDKRDEQTQDETRSSNTVSVPAYEEIAKLAHSYWLNRRPEAVTADDDWFRAEGAFSPRHSGYRSGGKCR